MLLERKKRNWWALKHLLYFIDCITLIGFIDWLFFSFFMWQIENPDLEREKKPITKIDCLKWLISFFCHIFISIDSNSSIWLKLKNSNRVFVHFRKGRKNEERQYNSAFHSIQLYSSVSFYFSFSFSQFSYDTIYYGYSPMIVCASHTLKQQKKNKKQTNIH